VTATEFDTVILGGRVIDPETGLDAIRSVGIRAGVVAAIADVELSGDEVLDARGLIVAPGFIDLHCHTQTLPGDRIQAFDGVTTALELESGILPVGDWYDEQAGAGRAINYGASASWVFARISELNPQMGEPHPNLSYFQAAYRYSDWQDEVASRDQTERILARLERGLADGALGIGINNGYVPGAGVQEMSLVADLAARYDVPTFTHIQFMSNIDPASSQEAYLRLIAYAATSGAHMHICHLNSTSLRDIERCAQLIAVAQQHGLRITVEAYPYGAASTVVGAAFLTHPCYCERTGSTWSDIVLNATGEPVLDEAELRRVQKEEPGQPIVWHFLSPETDPEHQRLLDMSVLYPGGAIASDAMPWEQPGHVVVDGDVWPIPLNAVAHPRSAGTFARFFAQYVTGRRLIALPEAVAKCTLIPAQILATASADAARKGRLQVGADADVTVFNLEIFQDQATFAEPAHPSVGVMHLLVGGTALIRDGLLDTAARPGTPVRGRRTGG
jgi:cytosine/adenosine deaminase-related metal-dependent hydrolase